MLIKLFSKLFELLIGKVPEEQREALRENFSIIVKEITKAAVKGAVKG